MQHEMGLVKLNTSICYYGYIIRSRDGVRRGGTHIWQTPLPPFIPVLQPRSPSSECRAVLRPLLSSVLLDRSGAIAMAGASGRKAPRVALKPPEVLKLTGCGDAGPYFSPLDTLREGLLPPFGLFPPPGFFPPSSGLPPR